MRLLPENWGVGAACLDSRNVMSYSTRRALLTVIRRCWSLQRPGDGPSAWPGQTLLRFVSLIDADDLATMQQSIKEGCEQIQPNEW